MLVKLKKILSSFLIVMNETKLGHQIKSFIVTFSGIYFGMIVLTPAWNAVFETDLPTIQEWKDLIPVAIDTLYRSVWALVLVEIGVYKYSSSKEEKEKSTLIPNK